MKFINSQTDSLSSRNSSEEIYDKSGTLTNEVDKAFGKILNVDLGDGKTQRKFFLRTYNNIPLDPLGPESRRDIWNRTELKVVSEKTFLYYLMYLKTKNGLYFTRTQRSYING
jgi:hypothetical protein